MKKFLTVLLVVLTISSATGCVSKNNQGNSSKESTQTNVTVITETTAEIQKEISKAEALEKVEELLGEQPKGFSVVYDHEESKEGKEFYVIHHFETVVDDPDTGEGHNATVGWYYVEKSKGEVFKWEVAEDKLTKLN